MWVEANTATLSILSSNAEVALGFLFILSLLSSVPSPSPPPRRLVSLSTGLSVLRGGLDVLVQMAAQHLADVHLLAGSSFLPLRLPV